MTTEPEPLAARRLRRRVQPMRRVQSMRWVQQMRLVLQQKRLAQQLKKPVPELMLSLQQKS
jgi:hypothetical protein